jgi:hypothetical protein
VRGYTRTRQALELLQLTKGESGSSPA